MHIEAVKLLSYTDSRSLFTSAISAVEDIDDRTVRYLQSSGSVSTFGSEQLQEADANITILKNVSKQREGASNTADTSCSSTVAMYSRLRRILLHSQGTQLAASKLYYFASQLSIVLPSHSHGTFSSPTTTSKRSRMLQRPKLSNYWLRYLQVRIPICISHRAAVAPAAAIVQKEDVFALSTLRH